MTYSSELTKEAKQNVDKHFKPKLVDLSDLFILLTGILIGILIGLML